jgi:penicillin amidase
MTTAYPISGRKIPKTSIFAQGWVHAQDRAWQLEFQRRVGHGKLSEILGDSVIETDRYLRTLGFSDVAQQEYEKMPEPYKGWLESYSEGVSAYLASRPPGRLGLEFAILRLKGTKWDVEPWTPVDSLVWAKMVVMSLSRNATDDVRRLSLLRFVGMSMKDSWFAPYRDDMPVTATEEELSQFRRTLSLPDLIPDGAASSSPLVSSGDGAGTNVWAISPGLSADKAAILVSDMHLGVQMPSIWHEIGLHIDSENHHVRGYTFPGIPGVVSGQNNRIAWGQANLRGDVQDYVIEQINPDNPDLYRVGDSWEPMNISYEIINVEGQDEPVVQQVRRTRNGPVMTDLGNYARLGSFTNDGELRMTELVMAWPALKPGHLIESVFMLNRAGNHEEFRDAITYWDAPSINFVYADTDGNIAYQAAGKHPERPAEEGRWPQPGWEKTFTTDRMIPFDALPGSLNPDKGYVVSSNNLLVYKNYPFYIGSEFSPGFRAKRISELIEAADGGLKSEDIAAIQMDVRNLQAEETWPFFSNLNIDEAHQAWLDRRESWGSEEREEPGRRELRKKAKAKTREVELLRTAKELMDDWDFTLETDSAAAAAFTYIWRTLIKETYYDELPEYSLDDMADTGNLENGIYYMLQNPGSTWWDDRRTPGIRETREDILARALVGGLLECAEELGDKPTKWEWGEVHTVDFRNQSLGESGIGPIENLFNRGPYPIRGGNSQVHKSNWKLSGGFEATTIQSQRAIYNTADPSRSLFMNTCGQSGHPFNRHYDDMIKPYLDGEFHPSRFTREGVEDSTGRRRLQLIPVGS